MTNKKTYTVAVTYPHVEYWEVEASSEAEALEAWKERGHLVDRETIKHFVDDVEVVED